VGLFEQFGNVKIDCARTGILSFHNCLTPTTFVSFRRLRQASGAAIDEGYGADDHGGGEGDAPRDGFPCDEPAE
jgi:hypothetical protein